MTLKLKELREFTNDVLLDFNDGLLKKDMAKKHNTSIDIISKLITENDLSFAKRRQMVDWNPFENLSDPNVMYWLGILASDGAIFEDRVTLQLAEVDRELVIKYHKFLKEKPTLRQVVWKVGGKNFNGYMVSFRNKDVVEFLDKLGITTRKSNTISMSFPVNSHFLRGLIDGDGTLEIRNIENRLFSRIRFATASTEMALSVMKFYLDNDLYLRYYKDSGAHRKSAIHEIVVSRSSDVLKLLDMLYNDADTYMERKYQKAVQIRNVLDNNTLNSGNQR